MKLDMDTLLREGNTMTFSPDLDPARQERIQRMTMKKIAKERRAGTGRKRTTAVIAVAAALAALCSITAVAAYEYGWFAQNAVVGEHAVSYAPDSNVQVTQPTYSEEEQKMIDEGTMTVPEQAKLADNSNTAYTDDYQYTLEEMLATEDTLYAIMRVDALNEAAKSKMSEEMAKGKTDFFSVLAMNNSGVGKDKERKNGGMNCKLLTIEDATGYYLLYNNGGQFATGDKILFHDLSENIDIFEASLTHLMDIEATVPLSPAPQENYPFDSMTVTPISLSLNGSGKISANDAPSEISVTLKDGVSFALACPSNDFANSSYGNYGSLAISGTADYTSDHPFNEKSWTFSRTIDLNEIAHITIDGVDYTLD